MDPSNPCPSPGRDLGTIHLVANEMFADNVERAIRAAVPRETGSARGGMSQPCPSHHRRHFTCDLRHARPYTKAEVTIVDGDGGSRLALS